VTQHRLLPCCLVLSLFFGCVAALFFAEPSLAAPSAKTTRHASVTEGMDCGACHTPDGWKTLGSASGGPGFDHSRTGFPLTQRHVGVACVSCHNADQPITRQCSGCHQDPHAAQLGASCDGCHSAVGWSQTQAFARHRQTRLPLTGMHALTECRDCHQRTTDRSWTSVPADCFACHADDYRRADIHPSHVGVPGDPDSPPFPRDCGQCHRATGWSPAFSQSPLLTGGVASSGFALSSARAHDRVFPLSHGPHRGADCQSCHVSRAAPQAVRCNGCHAHDEAKLRQQHQRVTAYSLACLACHPGGSAR
jgi:cytochrome c7-like protein